MAAPSKTDIINMALAHIKQRKIANLTEVSPQASEALRCYEIARHETLRGHDWGFATVVKPLALDATYTADSIGTYAGKWLYAYVYPSNAVAVWHVYNVSTSDKDNGEQFRVLYDDTNNKKVILTDTDEALAEYTFDVQDVTMYDANFVAAFAYRLAADMAPNLTGDDSIAGEMFKLYQALMQDAERMASYEAKDDSSKNTKSSYEESR
jgi:hypothetical protein